LSRVKRRRTKDVSRYVALVKNEDRLHLLNEFVPPPLAQRLVEKFPVPILDVILKTINGLEQEYRYLLLDRVLQNVPNELPKVVVFEELERAMIATVTGKLKTTFNFVIFYTSGRYDYRSDMCIELSK
jgi:hypothetical protein